LSNNIFEDETKTHPGAMTVQQNGHKSHAAIPSQKNENSKNSNYFLIRSCSTNSVDFDDYYVTYPLPRRSHYSHQ